MIEVVREFVLKAERSSEFELSFGPGGAWSKLVARSPGYRGTTLLRDTSSGDRYLMIDIWDTEAEWERAKAECHSELSELEASFEECSLSRRDLGVYVVRSQGTIRPVGTRRGGIATGHSRGSRRGRR